MYRFKTGLCIKNLLRPRSYSLTQILSPLSKSPINLLMKALKEWVDALKVNHVEYQSWCDEVPSDVSVTFWCLLKHKISPDDYLNWAKNHFELASLNEEYFSQSPNHSFWNMIQSVANWSPSLLPLVEWDGVVFVGCVEPPESVKWSFPVCYVLAPAEGLQNFWKQLNSAPRQTSPTPEPAVPTAVPAPIPTPLASNDTLNMDSLEGLDEPPTSSPLKMDHLEGLDLNLSSDSKSSTEPSMEGLNLNLNGDSGEKPHGLDLNLDAATSESIQIPKSDELTGLNLNNDIQTPPPPEEEFLPDLPDQANLEASQTPPLDVREESVTNSHVTSLNKYVPRHESPDDALIDLKIAPPNITDAQSENEIVAWSFKKLKEFFKQSMVLIFEGDDLKAWKWEKAWAPRSKESFEKFSTEEASIFRIVRRSKLPYHGHVVPSDANRQFFLNWGIVNLPEHVTLIPLLLEDQPVGILISMGDQAANTQQALVFAQRVGERLTESLKRVHSEAA